MRYTPAGLSGMGDFGDQVGDMAVDKVFSTAFSVAVTGFLQAFNIAIPGLGLVLGFAFKKLMGGDAAPDPLAKPMSDQMTALKNALAAKDYATAAQLAAASIQGYPCFAWLFEATRGAVGPLFFSAVIGYALQSGNRGPALSLAAQLDSYQPVTSFWNDSTDCPTFQQEARLRYEMPDALDATLQTRIVDVSTSQVYDRTAALPELWVSNPETGQLLKDLGPVSLDLALQSYDADQDLWKTATNPYSGNDG